MTQITSEQRGARQDWLDSLRLIAGVSMVGLHASADAAGLPFPDAAPGDKVIPLLFRAIVYMARTELFLIISLFLLLWSLERRPRGYGVTIREQARRLLIPFAFWTVFYALWTLLKADAFGYGAARVAALTDPGSWLTYALLGGVKYHMHFIPTLFGLVLLYPLFRAAVRQPWLGALVLVALLIKREVDVFLWANLTDWAGFEYLLRAVKILTYGGYGMVAGAAVGLFQQMHPGRLRPLLPALLWVGGGLFLIKLVHAWKVAQDGHWHFNYTPAYWADFLMPVLLFAGAAALADARWPGWLLRWAPYGFGIYLCHPIFLDLAEITTQSWATSPTGLILVKLALTLPPTLVLVRILGQSRWAGWTIGLGQARPTQSRPQQTARAQ